MNSINMAQLTDYLIATPGSNTSAQFDASKYCEFIHDKILEQYKRGVSLYQLQLFLNAYLQEQSLLNNNKGHLNPLNEDYNYIRGGIGKNQPDFIFND